MSRREQTRVERFIKGFQNHWFISLVVVLGVVVIAVGQFTESIDHIMSFMERIRSRPLEQRRQPTFSENLDKVRFSLGERGFTVGILRSDLESRPYEPFDFGGFKPIKVYVANGTLYADVEVYGGVGIASIKIQKNRLINRPNGWDMNSNDQALEVVNEDAAVVYQLYYRSPSHIVVNGIFPFPGGLILSGDSGAALNPKLPATFSLKRIFRYPSWKYSGQLDETAPTTTVVVSSG